MAIILTKLRGAKTVAKICERGRCYMKYREQFNAWWRPITLQGDPLHRADLVGDAFDGGYEAGKRDALRILCEDIESGNYRPSLTPLGKSESK